MSLSGIKPVTSISGSVSFCRKIIQKHQTGIKNTSGFPGMVFHKERRYFIHQKINTSSKFRLYSDKQNTLPFIIVKNIPIIRGIVSKLNIKKNVIQLINNPKNVSCINDLMKSATNVKNILLTALKISRPNQITSRLFPTEQVPASRTSVFSLLKHFIFRVGNTITEYDRILKSSLFDENTASFQQMFYRLYSINTVLNSQIFLKEANYRYLNIAKNFTFISDKNRLESQPLLRNKVPLILLQDSLVFNNRNPILNRYFFDEKNQGTVNKPLTKNYYVNFMSGASDSPQSTYDSKIGSESLFFHNQGRIEQEIENIKKSVIEAKESITKGTAPVLIEAEIRRCLDINRISSQVYQNIERKIRMERERRGI